MYIILNQIAYNFKKNSLLTVLQQLILTKSISLFNFDKSSYSLAL